MISSCWMYSEHRRGCTLVGVGVVMVEDVGIFEFGIRQIEAVLDEQVEQLFALLDGWSWFLQQG